MSRIHLTIAVLAAALAVPAGAQQGTPPPAQPAPTPAPTARPTPAPQPAPGAQQAPAAQPTPGTQPAPGPRPTAPPTGEYVSVPVEGGLELTTEDQKTFYALGLVLSQNLARLDLQASEVAYLVAGLEDGVLGREQRVNLEEYGPKVQGLAQQRFAAVAEREAAAGKQFVLDEAAREGAVKTDTGSIFFSLQEGQGASPADTDVVRVHYTGTLPNGEKFDSSVDRGEPATFPLNRVIPCWTEALQRMKVGGKARVVCPSELAYGAEGRPGIPPNSPLVFEVELLGIEKAEPTPEPAAPQGAAPGEELLQEVAEPKS